MVWRHCPLPLPLPLPHTRALPTLVLATQTRSEFSYDDFQHVEFAEDIIGDRNNFPFDSKDLVHYTKTPLFSREDCNAVIEEAEEYAAARGGWATQRHYSHPTTDILLEVGCAAGSYPFVLIAWLLLSLLLEHP